MSDPYNDYPTLIKQLKSMHIDQLKSLMEDIDNLETIALINLVSNHWLLMNHDKKVSEYEDAKQLDDAQRHRDIQDHEINICTKQDMRCYE